MRSYRSHMSLHTVDEELVDPTGNISSIELRTRVKDAEVLYRPRATRILRVVSEFILEMKNLTWKASKGENNRTYSGHSRESSGTRCSILGGLLDKNRGGGE